jgi:protein-tyrosine phosphatase
MAERLTAAYAARLQLRDLHAASAGTRAVIAHPIHHDAALVLERLGGDVSDFASRQLTASIAAEADLVLTMSRTHRDAVLELAPQRLRRTFTLSEAARLVSECDARDVADLAAFRHLVPQHELRDIPDPMGESAEYFQMIGTHIAELLPPILGICR